MGEYRTKGVRKMAEQTDNFVVYTSELEELEPQAEATTTADEQTETTEVVEDAQNTDDTATSEATPEAKEEEPKEGHSRYQKRIDKLVKQREEAEREKEALRRELEAIKSLPKKEATKTLDPLDFDSYEDYIEALNSQPIPKAKAKEEVKPTIDVDYQTTLRKLDDAFDDSREKYKDFDEVVSDPKVPFTTTMVQALAETDNAGEVAYYLAKNKKEVERIAQLSPLKQAIELGKVADKLSQPIEKKVTKAPEPINPVQAKGDAQGKDVSKMSYSEYEAYMNSQSKKKGFW